MIDFAEGHHPNPKKNRKHKSAPSEGDDSVPDKFASMKYGVVPEGVVEAVNLADKVIASVQKHATRCHNGERATPLLFDCNSKGFVMADGRVLPISKIQADAINEAESLLISLIVINRSFPDEKEPEGELKKELTELYAQFFATHGINAKQMSQQLTRNLMQVINTELDKEFGKGIG